MKGIDISAGSGTVDFKALKEAGYEFVIARAGYGSYPTQKDMRFDEYVAGALAAGLHVGAYWFIYATNEEDAEMNARAFLHVVHPYKGRLDMPLYIDYEYDSTRYYEEKKGVKETREVATRMIAKAAEVVEAAGYYTGVYLNPDYIRNHVNLIDLQRYTLWLAQWQVSKPSYKCELWQKAGDTKIAEAIGGVDINECYTDFPTVIRRAGINGFTPDNAPQSGGVIASGGRWEIVDDGSIITIKLEGKT